MFALPRQRFSQPGETEKAPAKWAGKSFAQAGDGLCEGSLQRQGSPAEKPRLLNKRKSLLGNQILSRADPLQSQLRVTAAEVKGCALN